MSTQNVQNQTRLVDKQRLAGRMQWLAELVAQGELQRAKSYAAKHSLVYPGEEGVDAARGSQKADHSAPSQNFPPKEIPTEPPSVPSEIIPQDELTSFRAIEDFINKIESGQAVFIAPVSSDLLHVSEIADPTRFSVDDDKAAFALETALNPGPAPEEDNWSHHSRDESPSLPIPAFNPVLETLPEGVRWAKVIAEPHNRFMKVIRFLDTKEEATCWVGLRDYLKGKNSMEGIALKVCLNPDELQGGWKIWKP